MTDRDRLAALLHERHNDIDAERTCRHCKAEADRLIAAGVTLSERPRVDEGLREAAMAVVDAWVDDESGMATFDPEVIDDLRRALDADEFARTAALAPAPEREPEETA
jgi:hypothetical protein